MWPGVKRVQSMALHMLSAIISDNKGSFIFFQIVLAALTVLIQYIFNVSSSLLLNPNKRLITFVSQPLILSRIALLQNQCSLPKENNAVDFIHHFSAFVLHGTSLLL